MKKMKATIKEKQKPVVFKKAFWSIMVLLFVGACCLLNYPDPVIQFDHQDDEGRMYISVVNWSDYPDELFVESPDLPPCGDNPNSSRTWVDIYDGATDAKIYGFCALDENESLQDIWFSPGNYSGQVYIIINDRKCKKNYKSNTIEYGECVDSFPDPVIAFDHIDNDGRVYIPVTNWVDYSDNLFRQAPEFPPCGLNTNSARTWVEIYNAKTDVRIYGFCALGTKEDLQDIWFKPDTPSGSVYIIMHDRSCSNDYKSNIVTY
ncbi:MAG: hypothetical protein GQ564_05945 [Bacteroidales bacterium]|nr:hypothetical protein [Bacteroidales bacterium]